MGSLANRKLFPVLLQIEGGQVDPAPRRLLFKLDGGKFPVFEKLCVLPFQVLRIWMLKISAYSRISSDLMQEYAFQAILLQERSVDRLHLLDHPPSRYLDQVNFIVPLVAHRGIRVGSWALTACLGRV